MNGNPLKQNVLISNLIIGIRSLSINDFLSLTLYVFTLFFSLSLTLFLSLFFSIFLCLPLSLSPSKNSICGFSTNFKQISLFYSLLKKLIVLNRTVTLSLLLKIS